MLCNVAVTDVWAPQRHRSIRRRRTLSSLHTAAAAAAVISSSRAPRLCVCCQCTTSRQKARCIYQQYTDTRKLWSLRWRQVVYFGVDCVADRPSYCQYKDGITTAENLTCDSIFGWDKIDWKLSFIVSGVREGRWQTWRSFKGRLAPGWPPWSLARSR